MKTLNALAISFALSAAAIASERDAPGYDHAREAGQRPAMDMRQSANPIDRHQGRGDASPERMTPEPIRHGLRTGGREGPDDCPPLHSSDQDHAGFRCQMS